LRRWITAKAFGFVFAFVLVALIACSLGRPRSGTALRASNPKPDARSATSARYPLRVGPSRRYLVDQRGRPFLIVGDSPQSLIVNVSLADAERFLSHEAASGFNTVWVNLLCNRYTGGRSDGTTYDKIAPFWLPGDLSTPNEAYFRRADAVIRLAAKHGITVFLDPIETGGWLNTLRKNDVGKSYAYGKWLGNRYKKFANIIWFNGNDFQQWRDPTANRLAFTVAQGIRAADPRHVQTVELDWPVSGSRDSRLWTPVIGLDAAYTYYPTYAQVLKEYDRPNFIPVFMVEANYEFEHQYTGPDTLRRQEYWALLSGAAGQLYGNKYTWQFNRGWKDHVDTTGVKQMQFVTKLFAHRPWFRLVPDQRHELIIAGFGTMKTHGSVNDSDFVTAARTPDGKLAIAYLPTRRAVTVDLDRFTGRVSAQWYDPTSGNFLRVRGSPFANAGSRSLAPPLANASRDDDWVLVLATMASKDGRSPQPGAPARRQQTRSGRQRR